MIIKILRHDSRKDYKERFKNGKDGKSFFSLPFCRRIFICDTINDPILIRFEKNKTLMIIVDYIRDVMETSSRFWSNFHYAHIVNIFFLWNWAFCIENLIQTQTENWLIIFFRDKNKYLFIRVECFSVISLGTPVELNSLSYWVSRSCSASVGSVQCPRFGLIW